MGHETPNDCIDYESLKQLVHYDPDSGKMTRIGRINPRTGEIKPIPAKDIGCVNGCGHLEVNLKSKVYTVHRLAVLYMTGEYPLTQVRHINREKTDNRWKNLRVVEREKKPSGVLGWGFV